MSASSNARWHYAIIPLVLAGVTLFANLGGAALFDQDEPLNAQCAREMYEAHDYIVPQFNHELRTAKPIMLYWLVMSGYALFGISEFAARFWSAVMSLGTVACTFAIATRLYSVRVGATAALVLSTAILYVAVGRACTPDPTLVFFTTLSLLLYVWGSTRRSTDTLAAPITWSFRSAGQSEWEARRQRRYQTASYAAMSCAVLTKGPVGLVLPTAVIGLFSLLMLQHASETQSESNSQSSIRQLIQRVGRWWCQTLSPRRWLSAIAGLRWWLAIVPCLLIAIPWYVLVGLQTDGEWIRTFLGVDNIGRFLTPMENHRGPFFYYIVVLFVGLFPWSVFLLPSFFDLIRRLRHESTRWHSDSFVASWAGVYVVFFSMAATKLPNYILPSYPAFAIIVAAYVERALIRPHAVNPARVRQAFYWLVGIGVVMAVALPVVAIYRLPGCEPMGLLGCILIIGGVSAAYSERRSQRTTAVLCVSATAVFFVVSTIAVAGSTVSRFQDGYRLARTAIDAKSRSVELAAYNFFSPNLVFYTHAPVMRVGASNQIVNFLDGGRNRLVVVPDDELGRIRHSLPAEVKTFGQCHRFLRDSSLTLIGYDDSVAASSTEVIRK